MSALPPALIAASAAVIFALGALHLWYTFRGNNILLATALYVGALALAAA